MRGTGSGVVGRRLRKVTSNVLLYLNDSTVVLTGTVSGLFCVGPDLIKCSEFININSLREGEAVILQMSNFIFSDLLSHWGVFLNIGRRKRNLVSKV